MNRAEAKAIKTLEQHSSDLQRQAANMQPGPARDAVLIKREWILVEITRRKAQA